MDALTQVGAWRDDAQVCEIAVRKRFCLPELKARGAQIIIEQIEAKDVPTVSPLELFS
jgi:Holliday junction resolvase RusA-like endonuclease